MVRVDYRTIDELRKTQPPGAKEFFAKLIRAKSEPEKHCMPICYKHIEGLAQSAGVK